MHLDKDQAAQVFGLDFKQIVRILSSGLLLLAIINIRVIIQSITSETILSKSDVQASFADQVKGWLSLPFLNFATLVIFWIAVGLVAYSVLYWLYSIYYEARNEVTVEKEYISPKSDKKELKKWPLVEFGLFAALVVFSVLTVLYLFPIINNWFVEFIIYIKTDWVSGLLNLLLATIGIFVIIYIYKVLISWMLIIE
ncbi:MAG: hypothetical protein QG675_326 [Patescibacteria group bacterium]|nr:hypothetical protein [Patescibacteria group bacterium]